MILVLFWKMSAELAIKKYFTRMWCGKFGVCLHSLCEKSFVQVLYAEKIQVLQPSAMSGQFVLRSA